MSVQATEVQALKQFALGQSQGQRFSVDGVSNILTLKPRCWGERFVRLLWNLLTLGRRDGFADMRWLVIAQKIQEKAPALFTAIQSEDSFEKIRSGLRSKVSACNASFRSSHPGWEQKQELAQSIRAIDRWVGNVKFWSPSALPPTS